MERLIQIAVSIVSTNITGSEIERNDSTNTANTAPIAIWKKKQILEF